MAGGGGACYAGADDCYSFFWNGFARRGVGCGPGFSSQWFVPILIDVGGGSLRVVVIASVFCRRVEHGWKTTFSLSRCCSSWAVKGCSVYSTRSEWKKPLNDNLQIKRLPSERLLRSDKNGRQATVNAVSDLPKKPTSWPSHALSWVTVLAASRRIAISVER